MFLVPQDVALMLLVLLQATCWQHIALPGNMLLVAVAGQHVVLV